MHLLQFSVKTPDVFKKNSSSHTEHILNYKNYVSNCYSKNMIKNGHCFNCQNVTYAENFSLPFFGSNCSNKHHFPRLSANNHKKAGRTFAHFLLFSPSLLSCQNSIKVYCCYRLPMLYIFESIYIKNLTASCIYSREHHLPISSFKPEKMTTFYSPLSAKVQCWASHFG